MIGYVYILQSLVNNRYYIGSTNDLDRRLQEHNDGRGKYTNLTKPFRLVFNQSYHSLNDARSIERRLKKMKSRKIIEEIIEDGYINLRA